MNQLAIDGLAEEIPLVTVDSLPAVVQALDPLGFAVAVSYDAKQQRLAFFRLSERVPTRESQHEQVFTEAQGASGGEVTAVAYKPESSDRVLRGSVTVPPGIWWSAELAVPTTGDQTALLMIERHGTGRTIGSKDATFVIPPGEADAVLTLLTGVINQARQQGVLSDPTKVTSIDSRD